jgi:hypothetical protein
MINKSDSEVLIVNNSNLQYLLPFTALFINDIEFNDSNNVKSVTRIDISDVYHLINDDVALLKVKGCTDAFEGLGLLLGLVNINHVIVSLGEGVSSICEYKYNGYIRTNSSCFNMDEWLAKYRRQPDSIHLNSQYYIELLLTKLVLLTSPSNRELARTLMRHLLTDEGNLPAIANKINRYELQAQLRKSIYPHLKGVILTLQKRLRFIDSVSLHKTPETMLLIDYLREVFQVLQTLNQDNALDKKIA